MPQTGQLEFKERRVQEVLPASPRRGVGGSLGKALEKTWKHYAKWKSQLQRTTVSFHSQRTPRIGKSMRTESRLVVDKG